MTTTYRFQYRLPGREGGEPVTEVAVRRPKVREIRAFEKVREKSGDFEASIAMLAALCDLDTDQVDAMDTVDFAALSEVLAGFTEGASPPATGAP